MSTTDSVATCRCGAGGRPGWSAGWSGRRHLFHVAFVALLFGGIAAENRLRAQGGLFINEVIADNNSTPPFDLLGGTPDMVEIYNAGGEAIVLGGCCPDDTYCLSDAPTWDPEAEDPGWCFPPQTEIGPGERLIIFCDNNINEGFCELHADFEIDSQGEEPISLWGPEDAEGNRPLVDQIWLPPLPENVAFGRSPDGGGPAPVPLEETLDVLGFFPPGTSTFGECRELEDRTCFVDVIRQQRECGGAMNGSFGNLRPHIERLASSTNAPGAGEPILVQAKVRDDAFRFDMTESEIAGILPDVQLLYRVHDAEPGAWEIVPMELERSSTVVQTGEARGRPLDLWTIWNASIPGQPAGTRVEFTLRARDLEQATQGPDVWSTSPQSICAEDVGPCDRQFGGPGCVRDEADVTCEQPPVTGQRYVSCSKPFTYLVGYELREEIQSLVINEVFPRQNGLHRDRTQGACVPGAENPTTCPVGDPENPGCCTEDFMEILNTGQSVVDLSGLWVSDSPFQPQGWAFPEGSELEPGEYVVVWLDNDGGKCPDESQSSSAPCFWECPDPNIVSMTWDPPEFHTNFALDANGDQVFLFDTEEHGFGMIHGIDFDHPEDFGAPESEVPMNYSLSLVPNGDRTGCFVLSADPTPRQANTGECPRPKEIFLRGDANSDCAVDLTDGVVTLSFLYQGTEPPLCQDAADADDNGVLELTDAIFTFMWLYSGGEEPPSPGPTVAGEDLTTDDPLPECEVAECHAETP